MQISTIGEGLIKSFEKLKLSSYLDERGTATIGWGHTQGVVLGQTCTEVQAEEWFKEDTAAACLAVTDLAQVPISQNQFDALVSFVYNVGVTAFAHSTLLFGLNHGWSVTEVASQFLKWDYAGKKESQGLENRRRAEAKLFATGNQV